MDFSHKKAVKFVSLDAIYLIYSFISYVKDKIGDLLNLYVTMSHRFVSFGGYYTVFHLQLGHIRFLISTLCSLPSLYATDKILPVFEVQTGSPGI